MHEYKRGKLVFMILCFYDIYYIFISIMLSTHVHTGWRCEGTTEIKYSFYFKAKFI